MLNAGVNAASGEGVYIYSYYTSIVAGVLYLTLSLGVSGSMQNCIRRI